MTKRVYIFFILCLLIGYVGQSQGTVSKHAIGLRLSEGNDFWAEASYQTTVSADTRIELDFGVQGQNNFNAIKFTGIYQWFFNIDKSLYWYVGPGIGGGLIDYDSRVENRDSLETFGFIAGDIGIEYHFDFPLMVAIDFRPEIYFDDFTEDDLSFNIGLSARYTFN